MKYTLTPVALVALAVGAVALVAYLITAFVRKKQAEMPGAFHVLASTAGGVGAAGSFFSHAGDVIVASTAAGAAAALPGAAASSIAGHAPIDMLAPAAGCIQTFNMGIEETVVFFAGSIAIIWISCQLVRREFGNVW